MKGQIFANDPHVTISQAARIVGVSRQAIWEAVERGTLKAEGPPRQRKIKLSQVIAYGVRNGHDARVLLQRAQKEINQPVDWGKLAAVVLAILGVTVLLELLKSEQEAPKEKAML